MKVLIKIFSFYISLLQQKLNTPTTTLELDSHLRHYSALEIVMVSGHDTHPSRSSKVYTFLFSFFFDIFIFLSFLLCLTPIRLGTLLFGRRMYKRRREEAFFDVLCFW
jgi:hypothetical protein